MMINNGETEEFESLLTRGIPVPLGNFRFYPGEMFPPEYLVHRDYIYGPIQKAVFYRGRWVIIPGSALKKITVGDWWKANSVMIQELAYVDSAIYSQLIVQGLDQLGEALAVAPAGPETPTFLDDEKQPDTGKPALIQGEQPQENTILLHDSPTDGSEENFLDLLTALAKKERLLYDDQDLINFHTALKTGSFVILAGMSGTGKSQLAHLYAQALGLTLGEDFVFIPVRPSWTDDSDLLGYLDTVNNIYRPAESGLVELLIRAEHNPERLYLVCFDEMNLARVEHYFSQFISIMEAPPGKRRLHLYNEDIAPRIYNANLYPPTINLGDNVLLVGTINVDESTYTISDKVLDRCNVIRPQMRRFRELKNFSADAHYPVDLPRPIPATLYREWRNLEKENIALSDAELDFLQELHELLNSIDQQKGIGFRIVRQIDLYIRNAPVSADGFPMIDRKSMFDHQIVQRVMPKLRGTKDQLEHIIGSLNANGEIENSALNRLLQQYEAVSHFEATRRVVMLKAKELKYYGYVS